MTRHRMRLFPPGTSATTKGSFCALSASIALLVVFDAVLLLGAVRLRDLTPEYGLGWDVLWMPLAYLVLHAVAAWRVARPGFYGFVFAVGFLCFSIGFLFPIEVMLLRTRSEWALADIAFDLVIALQIVALALLVSPPSTRAVRRAGAAAQPMADPPAPR